MNANEVAKELGVTERTVRRWIERGLLPREKNGRGLVIDLDEARKIASPRSAEVFDELKELRDLKARYEELERRYYDLLRILNPHAQRPEAVQRGN